MSLASKRLKMKKMMMSEKSIFESVQFFCSE